MTIEKNCIIISLVKKKVAFVLICITALGLFAAGFFVNKRFSRTQEVKGEQISVNAKELSEREERRLIADNTKKYQPQKTSKTATSGLDIKTKSAIVVDENTNEILYQKDPDAKLPPASITKISTIAVALENFKKDDLLTISEKAANQEPNKIVMKAGEKLKVDDLFYGLMMISANDAARAIAELIPGGFEKFIELMNKEVKLMGLKNTVFKNPSGLDEPGHISTAFDISTLTRYALLNHPETVTYAGKKDDHQVFPTDHNESHWWGHISGMLFRYPGMVAAKTGYTDEADSTFIGVAERNGRRLCVVILGSTDPNGDIPKLLDWGFAH